ncbi:TonB-dependent receptor plug domain-containing protein [Brevundimonas sp.]|uniref:TonB-dependent receptor plug domain-containing protein n=1 Tax=Brevundimonas sp. TaxID=1871086 RepID=UPI003565B492
MTATNRRRRLLGASILALSMSVHGAAAAQAPAPAAVDANVTPYLPAFFAEYRPVTALDMIGRIPGFQFDGGSSARGLAGTAGNVLIDGERPPVRSDSLQSVLSRIPAAGVLRIDVVRSGAGGIDMQGKPVVANVIRKPDAGLSGSVSGSANLSTTGDFNPGLTIQVQRQSNGRLLDGSVQLSGFESSQDRFRERYAPDGRLLLLGVADGLFALRSAKATGVYEGPLAGGRLRANGVLELENRAFTKDEILVIPGGREETLSDNDELSGEAGLRWNRSLPMGMSLEVIGSQQMESEESIGKFDTLNFTSDTVSDETTSESIVSGGLKFAPLVTRFGSVSLETGSEVALNWVERSTAFRLNDSPVLLPGDDARVEELRTESFATSVWVPRPDLSIETTLRYERSRITATGSAGAGETELSFLKPRLNVSWTPRPGHQLVLKVERNVEQLSFGAFVASASFETGIFGRGNPDIRPAQIGLAQLRYEYVFDRQGSFVAELTHEDIEDVLGQVVVVETPPGATQPVRFNVTRNVGSARRDTARFTGRLPLDRYGVIGGILSGSVNWRVSETKDPVTFLDRRLSGEQPFGWSLGFSQNLVARRISWGVNASSGFYSRNFAPSSLSTNRSDPSASANITWRPDPNLSLSAGFSYSSKNESEFTLFGGPRNLAGPVYNEFSTGGEALQAFVSARRSF